MQSHTRAKKLPFWKNFLSTNLAHAEIPLLTQKNTLPPRPSQDLSTQLVRGPVRNRPCGIPHKIPLQHRPRKIARAKSPMSNPRTTLTAKQAKSGLHGTGIRQTKKIDWCLRIKKLLLDDPVQIGKQQRLRGQSALATIES